MNNKLKKAAALALALVLLLFPALSVGALPPSEGRIYRGIDVSKWQGDIDFATVKASGVEIVYIRTGVGDSYKDPYFERNYSGAAGNGLLVGYYHYVTARSESEAEKEARYFVSLLSGKRVDGRLALDFGDAQSLGNAKANEIAMAFLESVERISGKKAMIYSSASGAKNVWSREIAARFPLWVAEYGPDEPADNGKWTSWAGFQYSNTGRVSGINGYVDLDKFTEEALQADPSPVPIDPPPPPENPERLLEITVERGDTLSRIAARCGATVSDIARTNEIADPNLIYAGQRLLVFATEQGCEGTPVYTYTVKRGDTLSGIARRFHTTAAHLAGVNKLDNPNLIYPGQVLDI